MKGKIFLKLLFLFLFNTFYSQNKFNINDGIGYNKIILNLTNADETIALMGKNYKLIKRNDISYEIKYDKKGISFFYLSKDTSKKISLIEFYKPFAGITIKGIKIGNTLQEVLNIYGKPQYNGCDDCDDWSAGYPELGIYFNFKRDLTLPHFPLQEKKHLNEEIFEITIRSVKDRAMYAPPLRPPTSNN